METGYASRNDWQALEWLNRVFLPKEGFWWFIEHAETHLWLCEDGSWTNDPHKCMKWDTEPKAIGYCNQHSIAGIIWTEHEFTR